MNSPDTANEPPRNPIFGTRIFPLTIGGFGYDWQQDPYFTADYLASKGGNVAVVNVLRGLADIVDSLNLPRGLIAYDRYLFELPRFGKDGHPPAAKVWEVARRADDPSLDQLDAFLLADVNAKDKISLVERIAEALHDYFAELDRIEGDRLRKIKEAKEALEREQAVAKHDQEVLAPQKALTKRIEGSQSTLHRKLNELQAEYQVLLDHYRTLLDSHALKMTKLRALASENKELREKLILTSPKHPNVSSCKETA